MARDFSSIFNLNGIGGICKNKKKELADTFYFTRKGSGSFERELAPIILQHCEKEACIYIYIYFNDIFR